MRRAVIPIFLSVLALAGCTSRPDAWYRAASTPEQADRDERRCRDDATQVARQRSRMDANIQQDRSAGGYGPSGASVSRSDLNIKPDEQLADVERGNIRDLVRACMADSGYRLMRDD